MLIKSEARNSKYETIFNDQNSKEMMNEGLGHWRIGNLNLPALLSGFGVTSDMMCHDPPGKSKIVNVGQNYLTG